MYLLAYSPPRFCRCLRDRGRPKEAQSYVRRSLAIMESQPGHDIQVPPTHLTRFSYSAATVDEIYGLAVLQSEMWLLQTYHFQGRKSDRLLDRAYPPRSEIDASAEGAFPCHNPERGVHFSRVDPNSSLQSSWIVAARESVPSHSPTRFADGVLERIHGVIGYRSRMILPFPLHGLHTNLRVP